MLGMGRAAPPATREGAGRFGLLNEPHPVRGADGDLSGRVSLEEWRKAAARRFNLLDLDGDGRVLGADGAADPRLFVLGPPARAAFWETIAVPDIRQRIEAVAAALTA